MSQLGKSNLNLNLNLNLGAGGAAAGGSAPGGVRINTQEFRKLANIQALGDTQQTLGEVRYREFWDPELQANVYLNAFVVAHPDWLPKLIGVVDGKEKQLRAEIDDQLKGVLDAAPERESRFAEIVHQDSGEGAISYFAGMIMLVPSASPATTLLIQVARRIGELVAVGLKHHYRFPRPSQLCPAVVPMFDPPAHPSFPSGHSLQCRLIARCLEGARGGVPQSRTAPPRARGAGRTEPDHRRSPLSGGSRGGRGCRRRLLRDAERGGARQDLDPEDQADGRAGLRGAGRAGQGRVLRGCQEPAQAEGDAVPAGGGRRAEAHMISTRSFAPVSSRTAPPPAVVRRIEFRVAPGQDVSALDGDLVDLAKRASLQPPVRRRRDPVLRRLDVELAGDPVDVAGVVDAIAARPGVEVMRDEVLPPAGTQDPLYPDPAVLRRVLAPAAGHSAGLNRPGEGGSAAPVVVAIVDSGVMAEHPDLASHLWKDAHGRYRRRSLIGDSFEDEDGHGTLLAGMVLTGAALSPEVRLLPVKFIDGRTRPDSGQAAEAIRWAADTGADVINLSWEVGIADPRLRAAIEHAGAKGALVVVAAGNSGADNDRLPAFPACYGHDNCQALPGAKGLSHVITVMASDRLDGKPGFSNYGKQSVHIAAPGLGVFSTHSTFGSGLESGDPKLYQSYDGSSAAAAFVAGAAALLKTRNRKLSAEAIKKILLDTAEPKPYLPCQRGRLNLNAALAAVQATPGARLARGASRAAPAAPGRAPRTAR